MAVQEVVTILSLLVEDDGTTLEQRHGPQAVSLARDMKSLLSARLQEESAQASLWEQFEAQPQEEVVVQLTGALEALLEGDPALARRLDELVEEYYQAIAPSEAPAAVPETTPTVQREEVSSEGAYFYEDIAASTETVGRETGVEEAEFGEGEAFGSSSLEITDVRGLFEQLSTAVEARQNLSPAFRTDVNAELQQLQAEMARGDEADEEALVRHLHNIQRLAPDVSEKLLAGLAGFATDLKGPIQKVVRETGAA